MPSARPAQNAVRRPLNESCSAAAASAVRSADSRIGWYGCCASAGLATRAIASATATTFIVTILLEGAWTAGKALKPYNTEVTYSSVFSALRWIIWRADSVFAHERAL